MTTPKIVTSADAVALGVSLPTAHAIVTKLGLKDANAKRKIRRAWHGRAGIEPDLLEQICDAYEWNDFRCAIAMREMAARRRAFKAGDPFDPRAGQ